MQARGIPYRKITASRYAKGMIREIRTHDPATLIDKLICGAYIEARSCERFAKLAPHLDDELNCFYVSLLRSEARHYQDYLTLAEQIAGGDISERVAHFGRLEAELILSPDSELRFTAACPPRPEVEAHPYCGAPSNRSTAFSASMMVGALVLPLVSCGITEQSITRSRSKPCTRSCGSVTASCGDGPTRQLPTG